MALQLERLARFSKHLQLRFARFCKVSDSDCFAIRGFASNSSLATFRKVFRKAFKLPVDDGTCNLAADSHETTGNSS